MTEHAPIDFRLVIDGNSVAVTPGMTLGRHLDNDLIVAGEDIADHHLRIDLSPRGPVAVPLGRADCHLNGAPLELPTGLKPGDRLQLGQTRIELEARTDPRAAPVVWYLYRPGEDPGLPIRDVLRVGRDPANDLQISDPHVSRRHAQLHPSAGAVWVLDLESANGTYVDGERIRGARRLFDGDEVRFDRIACRLLAHQADDETSVDGSGADAPHDAAGLRNPLDPHPKQPDAKDPPAADPESGRPGPGNRLRTPAWIALLLGGAACAAVLVAL